MDTKILLGAVIKPDPDGGKPITSDIGGKNLIRQSKHARQNSTKDKGRGGKEILNTINKLPTSSPGNTVDEWISTLSSVEQEILSLADRCDYHQRVAIKQLYAGKRALETSAVLKIEFNTLHDHLSLIDDTYNKMDESISQLEDFLGEAEVRVNARGGVGERRMHAYGMLDGMTNTTSEAAEKISNIVEDINPDNDEQTSRSDLEKIVYVLNKHEATLRKQFYVLEEVREDADITLTISDNEEEEYFDAADAFAEPNPLF